MNEKFLFLFFCLCAIACNPDKYKTIDLKDIRFATTDASEIFFKNVRKSTYNLQEDRQAGIDLYTLNQLTKSDVPLMPLIIISWRTDMAFFHFENRTTEETLMILVDTDTLSFHGTSQKEHAILAASMYNAILQDKPVVYLVGGKQKDFFANAKQMEAFRIMFFDFLRLVELR